MAVAVGAYLAILAVWGLAIGRQPTLFKGRSLLILNVAFVAFALLALPAGGQRPGYELTAFLVMLIVAGFIARDVWVLFHIDRAGAAQIIEKCLAQTRAKHELREGRYLVHTAPEDMVIDIRGAPPALRIRFDGGSGSRKAELIRSLFGKQVRGAVPTLRVRT